jgi:hypothetical protein
MSSSIPRPVLVVFSVLAGMQAAYGMLLAADLLPVKVVAALGIVTGAAQAGLAKYVEGKVTPWSTVAAQRRPDGTLVAGPAAPGTTKTDTPVDVTQAEPPHWLHEEDL